jgi:hypothetical protein
MYNNMCPLRPWGVSVEGCGQVFGDDVSPGTPQALPLLAHPPGAGGPRCNVSADTCIKRREKIGGKPGEDPRNTIRKESVERSSSLSVDVVGDVYTHTHTHTHTPLRL